MTRIAPRILLSRSPCSKSSVSFSDRPHGLVQCPYVKLPFQSIPNGSAPQGKTPLLPPLHLSTAFDRRFSRLEFELKFAFADEVSMMKLLHQRPVFGQAHLLVIVKLQTTAPGEYLLGKVRVAALNFASACRFSIGIGSG